MNMNQISLVLFFACLGQIQSVLDPKVVCYYEYWLNWRTGLDKITVADIDTTLCTHVVYFGARVNGFGYIDFLNDKDFVLGSGGDLKKFGDHKGSAKAILAVLESSMASVVGSDSTRTTFVNDVVKTLQDNNLDGILIDWRNQYNADYATLLHQLKAQFGNKYTLAISLGAAVSTFKISEVDKYVDLYGVQTFDYHGAWNSEAGHIVGHEAPSDWQLEVLKAWEDAGAEPSKLLMTLPMYGRTWILDSANTSVGATARGPGHSGTWSQQEGFLGYNELCQEIESNKDDWEFHPDAKVDSIYAVDKRTSTWVTFETTDTVKTKTNKATALGYGGVIAVSLTNDDHSNVCNQGKYPLVKAINAGLDKSAVTRPPHTSTTPVHFTVDPNKVCQKTGTVRDPKDCNTYHKCVEVLPGIVSDDVEHCPKGEAFDEKDLTCKDSSKVPGC